MDEVAAMGGWYGVSFVSTTWLADLSMSWGTRPLSTTCNLGLELANKPTVNDTGNLTG